MRVGLGLTSGRHGDSYFTLLATHRANWLNTWGGEWRNDVQIGHANRLPAESCQPPTPAQRCSSRPCMPSR